MEGVPACILSALLECYNKDENVLSVTAALSLKWSLDAHMASRPVPTPITLGKTEDLN